MQTRTPLIVFILLALVLATPALFAQTNCETGNGILDSEWPANFEPEAAIRKFLHNESVCKVAQTKYTFTHDITIQTLSGLTPSGKPIVDGEFREVMDVSFDQRGARVERINYAPVSTLRRINMGPKDIQDLREFMGFPVTADNAAQYRISFRGRQHVDQLDTYVFDIEPRTIERDKRYFSGRVWVEERDLAIVKTCGKSVPDETSTKVRGKREQDVTPKFVTYREQSGANWFPTYARSDDFLWFSTGHVRIREIVKCENYRSTSQAVPGQALTPKSRP